MWLIRQVSRRSRRSDWRGYFLIACVALLALLLAGASWSALQSSRERRAAESWQVHTLEVLLETDRLRVASLQQIRGERGFLLTGNSSFLAPYRKGVADARAAHDRLEQLIADNPAQARRLAAMNDEFARLDMVFSAMIDQERTGRHAEAVHFVRLGNDRDAIDGILRQLDAIESVERGLLAQRTATARRRAEANERYQYALTLIGALLLALSAMATFSVRRALTAEAAAVRELQKSASTDALTGLANRRSFIAALERSLTRAGGERRTELCLAIFDIDHFKRVNDRFGHPAGDAVIREVAERSAAALRGRDLVGRIGGEEFAIILPKADIAMAESLCERLRAAVAGRPIVHHDAIIPFTISIGIAEFQPGDDVDHIMARADAALYDAKTGGRNQVRLAA